MPRCVKCNNFRTTSTTLETYHSITFISDFADGERGPGPGVGLPTCPAPELSLKSKLPDLLYRHTAECTPHACTLAPVTCIFKSLNGRATPTSVVLDACGTSCRVSCTCMCILRSCMWTQPQTRGPVQHTGSGTGTGHTKCTGTSCGALLLLGGRHIVRNALRQGRKTNGTAGVRNVVGFGAANTGALQLSSSHVRSGRLHLR